MYILFPTIWSYIDPVSGSILLQVIIAGVIGGLAYFFRPLLRLARARPAIRRRRPRSRGRASRQPRSILMTAAAAGQTDPVAGSFRDPASQAFFHRGKVFRAIDDATHEAIAALAADGCLQRLQAAGLLVPTEFVQDPALVEEPTAAGARLLAFSPAPEDSRAELAL